MNWRPSGYEPDEIRRASPPSPQVWGCPCKCPSGPAAHKLAAHGYRRSLYRSTSHSMAQCIIISTSSRIPTILLSLPGSCLSNCLTNPSRTEFTNTWPSNTSSLAFLRMRGVHEVDQDNVTHGSFRKFACPTWRILLQWLEADLDDAHLDRVSRHVYWCRGCWRRLRMIDGIAAAVSEDNEKL